MIHRWFSNTRVFMVWLLGLALTVVLLALLHDLLMVFIVNTLHWTKYIVRFTNMFYYFPAGLVCIMYITLALPYLNRSARTGKLAKTSLRLTGTLVLLIGLSQLGLIGYRYLSASLVNILLAGVEILVGVMCLVLSSRQISKIPATLKEKNDHA